MTTYTSLFSSVIHFVTKYYVNYVHVSLSPLSTEIEVWKTNFSPEMDFLDINLRLESFAPCYSQSLLLADLKKNKLYSTLVLKIFNKKPAKQGNSSLFLKIILQNRKIRVENQTKTRVWEDLSLCPETLTKNAVRESISVFWA